MLSSFSKATIFLEDEKILQNIVDFLSNQGVDVIDRRDTDGAEILISQVDPDIVIMSEENLSAHNFDQLALINKLTDGIVVVVGEGSEYSVVNALLQGADLYVEKPINYRILLARLRSLARRTKSS